jgi:ribosomal peptide maturation radical SAM protein 1
MRNSNDQQGQEKLLLMSMPFSTLDAPSIQLGTLSGYLRNKGIPVDVHHAYLRCAEILDPLLYRVISYSMRDEIFYPYFLYPANFQRYRYLITNYFNTLVKYRPISLETVLDRLHSFNEELLTKYDFSQYSLIGFSVTYDQLKSSLFLSRQIKQRYPDIPIVFGGAYCNGDLGISLLKTFSEIDFIVSGEGEETLTTLFNNLATKQFAAIKGLGWRDNGSVKFNGSPDTLHLDSLPIPDFEDYFHELDTCSLNFKNSIKYHLFIPVEGSRGCWWNRCTFCNLNSQYSGYREKSVARVIEEVKKQVNKYQCHSISFVDNIQRIKNIGNLMSGLKELNQDLNMFLEIRPGHLKKQDYRLMRDAGVTTVQIGIEAFGNKYLKKMNKGVTNIENLAAIKYCQEFGILTIYNLIINYPNEDQCDLDEASENIKFLKSYIPPWAVNSLGIYHGSPVYRNPQDFNIRELKIPDHALWRFPQEIWQTLISFCYDYTCISDGKDRRLSWQEVLRTWQQTGRDRIHRPLLYYQDTGEFLTITDQLSENSCKRILKGVERELYLFCDSIQTRSAVIKRFPDSSPDYLEGILGKWIAKRWMFREEDKFLSLAIRISPMISAISFLSNNAYKYLTKNWDTPPIYGKKFLKSNFRTERSGSIAPRSRPINARTVKNPQASALARTGSS